MVFSERMRMLIEERNITQKQLASDLAIPGSTLGGYVQGTSEPDFQMLIMIADYFHVTTDYLLGHFGDQTENDREDDLLRVFRCLTPVQQETYLEQGKAIIKVNMKEPAKSPKPATGAGGKTGR